MNPIQEKIAVITDDKEPPANRISRWLVLPALRPSLKLCPSTPITLNQGDRVIIAQDQGAAAHTLVAQLETYGVTPLILDPAQTAVTLANQLQTWLADGRIRGLYWLPALDEEPAFNNISLADWRELRRVRLVSLQTVMPALEGTDVFLVAATRLGGLLGSGDSGAINPLGGAVAGFIKAYRQAHDDRLVKVVDFEVDPKMEHLTGTLLAETLIDPGVTEVGYWRGQRFTPAFAAQPAASHKPGVALNRQTVFLVAGAAAEFSREVVAGLAAIQEEPASEDVVDLALATGSGTFYLLDTLPPEDTAVQHLIQAIEKAGGDAIYQQVDLTDDTAVTVALQKINGRLDVLIHADGQPDSLFNLLQASREMPVSVVMAFNGADGRFGNAQHPAASADQALISALVSQMRQERSETRGLVIDWLERDSDQTVAIVQRELINGQAQGEILTGGQVQARIQAGDERITLEKAPARQRLVQVNAPLLVELTTAGIYSGLHGRAAIQPEKLALTPAHSYLPWGIGLEALAEMALTTAPDYHVAVLENARFAAPIPLADDQTLAAELRTAVFPALGHSLLAHSQLRSQTDAPHLTAQARLVARPITGRPQIQFAPPASDEMVIDPAVFYTQTTAVPPWQFIEQAHVVGDQIVARLRQSLPPALLTEAMIYSPALLEFALQAADLWQFYRHGKAVRPSAFQSATIFRQPAELTGRPLFAIVRPLGNGRAFDVQIVDENAYLFGIVTGYQNRKLS